MADVKDMDPVVVRRVLTSLQLALEALDDVGDPLNGRTGGGERLAIYAGTTRARIAHLAELVRKHGPQPGGTQRELGL